MFKLSEQELQNGFEAIEHHGYSALLPSPPEWAIVRQEWLAIRSEMAAIDLDTYAPVHPLRIYAPKNRATVRVVSLLHPVDLIIYTSLTLIVLEDIEKARIPQSKKVVFSYRSNGRCSNRLYGSGSSFTMFRQRLIERANQSGVRYVGIADIADFYPRIYQHRLDNVIESCSSSNRGREVSRVLVRKLISHLSGDNSYGIPVGPYASRVLAEAVLIDVDAYLQSEGAVFVRWVDDYYFFTRTEQQSQKLLISLAQWLYEKHGLTLSALKTKIQSIEQFRRRFEIDPDLEVDGRIQMISEFSSRFDPYSDEEVDLTDEERAEIADIDISDLIERALEDRDLIDYETLSALLKHPELLSILPVESRKRLGEILLRHSEHLYPITGVVAEFFSTFANLTWGDMKRIRTKLLSSLRPKYGKWPPDYYMVWILSLFASDSAWRHASDFTRILRDHRSEIVRRQASLAIARNGNRADAVEARDQFTGSSPLEQLAILMATRNLGQDERRHWKRSLNLTGPLEKRI